MDEMNQNEMNVTNMDQVSADAASMNMAAGAEGEFAAADNGAFDPYAAQNGYSSMAQKAIAEDEIPENVFGGIIGAIVGTIPGIALMIILGQIGYVASIAGFVMAAGALYGYKLLGKKTSVKGVVISIVIMIAMIYLGERISWTISLVRELSEYFEDVSFMAVFTSFHGLLGELEVGSQFLVDLLMVYGFSVLGAFSTIKKAFSRK